ncbi:sugar transferase [Saccharopolyspora elongata]|uniref:Sugar transferase n=1 Tax=Saccharopolyspora elongata TaxID=2530387 RepID=A0A4V2YK02_9PSEU|nr:sugar transferase [Saccharopolyspora elongata]TDD40667.1 sugar transferase [Saccharopolyspora elongata]
MQEPMRAPMSLPDGVGSAGMVRAPRLNATAPPAHLLPALPEMAWERRYRLAVIASDAIATAMMSAAGAVWVAVLDIAVLPPPVLALLTAVAVLSALVGSWNVRVLGQGHEEYRRLGRGIFSAGVVLAVAGLAVPPLDVRPWVFGVLPALALLVLAQRYVLRRYLHSARSGGRCLLPVIAAGSTCTLRDLIARTRRQPHVGWQIQALCLRPEAGEGLICEVDGVPVIGDVDELAEHVRRGGYRVVAITADSYWTPRRLQELAWKIEDTSAEMVVAPVLMEITGPRLHVSSVLGMPMLKVSEPSFTGGRRVVKALADWVSALLLLGLIGPAMLVIALAVKLSDGGPVIYRQRRTGRGGTTFTMLKFRTMVVGADAMRTALRPVNDAEGPLFKLRRDPRVTKVGGLLRRYSLDELPQLFNVLAGHMSLVGPRPPLPEETATYDYEVGRRLLVKPGLTGLWQVSGRSDLSWAESVRLDLRYVENWSLAMDAVILWKTVRAVLTKQGAY